ncbi:hypothetical protein OF83DRAFT_1138449 [Amylostereum chailletii]|nr:hypothetical protein OF83DRAFT_1138449 [Amylostereum chailletii]
MRTPSWVSRLAGGLGVEGILAAYTFSCSTTPSLLMPLSFVNFVCGLSSVDHLGEMAWLCHAHRHRLGYGLLLDHPSWTTAVFVYRSMLFNVAAAVRSRGCGVVDRCVLVGTVLIVNVYVLGVECEYMLLF